MIPALSRSNKQANGNTTEVKWEKLMECPTIQMNGSYEDFKILAATYDTDAQALLDLHRYDGKINQFMCVNSR